MSVGWLPVTDFEWEDSEEVVCTRDLAAYDEGVTDFDAIAGPFAHYVH